MIKRVVVIASGATERSALPHLLAHLEPEGVTVDIRIPDRNRQLTPNVVHPIIYSLPHESHPPDKVVVLVDTDDKSADDAMQQLKQNSHNVASRTRIPFGIHYAYAQWHLEAWFFADERHLREYLGGRALGSVGASQPDSIQNPKLHLKNLLPRRIYTAQTSERIARTLDAHTIAQHSLSFAAFLTAVRNGGRGSDANAAD